MGCNDETDPKPNPDPQSKPKITEKSFVFNDIAKLSGPFAFAKTMDKIIATSGGVPTSSVLMLKSMVDSFAENSFTHPVSGKTIDVTRRQNESVFNPRWCK
ncbi:hypothetical protein [Nitrosomonas sp.]|uniref:hypothetical protein n=1 Tax=Nitrosomonas sp. TaxID=42353 RepID=UPI0032F0588A